MMDNLLNALGHALTDIETPLYLVSYKTLAGEVKQLRFTHFQRAQRAREILTSKGITAEIIEYPEITQQWYSAGSVIMWRDDNTLYIGHSESGGIDAKGVYLLARPEAWQSDEIGNVFNDYLGSDVHRVRDGDVTYVEE